MIAEAITVNAQQRVPARARTSSTVAKRHTVRGDTYRFIWATQRSATSLKDARIAKDIERLTRTFCVIAPKRRRLRRPSLDTAVIAGWLTQSEWP